MACRIAAAGAICFSCGGRAATHRFWDIPPTIKPDELTALVQERAGITMEASQYAHWTYLGSGSAQPITMFGMPVSLGAEFENDTLKSFSIAFIRDGGIFFEGYDLTGAQQDEAVQQSFAAMLAVGEQVEGKYGPFTAGQLSEAGEPYEDFPVSGLNQLNPDAYRDVMWASNETSIAFYNENISLVLRSFFDYDGDGDVVYCLALSIIFSYEGMPAGDEAAVLHTAQPTLAPASAEPMGTEQPATAVPTDAPQGAVSLGDSLQALMDKKEAEAKPDATPDAVAERVPPKENSNATPIPARTPLPTLAPTSAPITTTVPGSDSYITDASKQWVYVKEDGGAVIVGKSKNNRSLVKELILPSQLDGLPVVGIGHYAFDYDIHIERVVIPDTVRWIGINAFVDCTSLREVVLPQGLEALYTQAFGGCKSLARIEIPGNVHTIISNPFSGCPIAAFVVAPENRHFKAVDGVIFTKDGTSLIAYPKAKGAYYEIPAGTVTIADGAFRYADLMGVVIPDTVTGLGAQAFHGEKFTSLTIPASVSRFDGSALGHTSCAINVTKGSAAEQYLLSLNYWSYNYTENTPADNIRILQSAVLDDYPQAAFGEALTALFPDVRWDSYTGDMGRIHIVATAGHSNSGAAPAIQVDYLVYATGRVFFQSFARNGIQQTQQSYVEFLSDVYAPYRMSPDTAILMVQTGALLDYPNQTIEAAFGRYFSDLRWNAVAGGDGYVYVNMTGGFNYNNRPSEVFIQFRVAENGSFGFSAFEINGNAQDAQALNALLRSVYQ